MESKIQETLQLYKNLAMKNIKNISSLSKKIAEADYSPSKQPNEHFQSIKHHYDQLLQASKLSIHKNEQLRTQLQDKRQHFNLLKQKLQKNYEYMQGLEIQMIRTNNNIKKQRKNHRQSIQQHKKLNKLKSLLIKYTKRKADLQNDIRQIIQKQTDKNNKLIILQRQIQQIRQESNLQQRKELKKISQLQKQIEGYKQSFYMLKERSDRSVTPQNKDKSIIFQDVIMNIQQFRKSHFG